MDAATSREFASNPAIVVGGWQAFTRAGVVCVTSESWLHRYALRIWQLKRTLLKRVFKPNPDHSSSGAAHQKSWFLRTVPNRHYSYPQRRWLPAVVFASRGSLTRWQTWSYRRACSGWRAQGRTLRGFAFTTSAFRILSHWVGE